MKDFILGLYANENFPIYLGTIILVLLLAFFVVFFLGKKDKEKIEKTQRLETIKDDAFKNVSAPVSVEVPTVETPSALESNINNETQTVNLDSMNVSEEVMPVVDMETVSEQNVTNEVAETIEPVIPEPTIPEINIPSVEINSMTSEPVIEIPDTKANEASDPDVYKSPQSVEGLTLEKPVPKFDPEPVIEPYIPEPDLSNFNELASSIESELTALEKQQEIAKPIINSVEPVMDIPKVEPVVDAVNSSTIPVIEMPVAPLENEAIINNQTTSVINQPIEVNMPSEPVQPVLQPIETEEIKIQPETEKTVTSNPTKVMTDVFSSVYAPKKETPAPIFEDTMAIELPRLKDEQ